MIQEIRSVAPGDEVPEDGRHCLGIHQGRAVVAGVLCKLNEIYFIKSKTKKYNPMKHDIVIGTVIYVSGEYYKVDVSGYIGFLPVLSFPNAVKRNRPILTKGESVAARVLRVDCGDLLLSCREMGLGLVDEFFQVPSWKIRLLCFSNFLNELGKNLKYQIILGMNGCVWIGGTAKVKAEVLRALDEYQSV